MIYVCGVHLPWPRAVRGQFCEVFFPTFPLCRFLGIEQRSHACVEIACYLVSRLIALKSLSGVYLPPAYLSGEGFIQGLCLLGMEGGAGDGVEL